MSNLRKGEVADSNSTADQVVGKSDRKTIKYKIEERKTREYKTMRSDRSVTKYELTSISSRPKYEHIKYTMHKEQKDEKSYLILSLIVSPKAITP